VLVVVAPEVGLEAEAVVYHHLPKSQVSLLGAGHFEHSFIPHEVHLFKEYNSMVLGSSQSSENYNHNLI
jgi:hypothetical protein